MKERLGNLWTETDTRGVLKIGFSREYIENKLGECFHVMQADRKFARKGQPLLVMETNDAVERLPSPVTGTILKFNNKASNFPDRLNEEDVILEVLPEGIKLPVVDKAKVVDDWISQNNVTWNAVPFQQQTIDWAQMQEMTAPQVPPPITTRTLDDVRREQEREAGFRTPEEATAALRRQEAEARIRAVQRRPRGGR